MASVAVHLLQGDSSCGVGLVQPHENPDLWRIGQRGEGVEEKGEDRTQEQMFSGHGGMHAARQTDGPEAPKQSGGSQPHPPSPWQRLLVLVGPPSAAHLEKRVEQDGHGGHKYLECLILRPGGRVEGGWGEHTG